MLCVVEVAEVAARAAGENFPVGSILFPRSLRPHVRALYCYARFVDELGDAELVAASDSVCTGLQLVNFLQDVPRDLALGRVYLPLEDLERFGSPGLDRPSDELRTLLRFEADRAAALLREG